MIVNGANTNTIQVVWNTNCTLGSITLIKTNTITGCSAISSTPFSVTVHPLPTPVVIGNTSVVTGTNEVYSTTNTSGHLYSWSVVGGSIISGQGTNSITVAWDNALCAYCTAGSVSLTETSVYGCEATSTINITIAGPSAVISGTLTYDNTFSTPINGATVQLVNTSNVVVATTTTQTVVDASPAGYTVGYYEFTNIPTGTYSLRLTNPTPWGGVNATDALKIKRHVASLETLTGLALTAANVNLASGVNSTDALLVQLRTAGLVGSFAAGNWVYSGTSASSAATRNITALATGDVNKSYVPAITAKAATYTNLQKEGVISANNAQLIELPIRVSDVLSLGAVTLDLAYNNSLVDVMEVTSQLNGFEYNINNGKITVVWSDINAVSLQANDAIVTLKVRAKEAISSTSDIFSFGNNTEFADANGNVINFNGLKVNGIESDSRSNDISVYPNPFKNNTEVIYNMVESGSVRIALYNAVGQRMEVLVDEYKTAGNYNYSLNTSDIPSGVYSCEIIINGETSKYKKVIKLVKTN